MQLINESIPADLRTEFTHYVSLAYILSGKAQAYTYPRGMFYGVNDIATGFTLNPLHHYKETGYELEDVLGFNMLKSETSTMLANHLSDETQCIIPKDAELDFLTDLLTTLYENMKRRDPVSGFVTMQAFMLMNRVVTDRMPIIGPSPADVEVKPYAL